MKTLPFLLLYFWVGCSSLFAPSHTASNPGISSPGELYWENYCNIGDHEPKRMMDYSHAAPEGYEWVYTGECVEKNYRGYQGRKNTYRRGSICYDLTERGLVRVCQWKLTKINGDEGASSGFSGCQYDDQCRDDRVCENGRCTSPQADLTASQLKEIPGFEKNELPHGAPCESNGQCHGTCVSGRCCDGTFKTTVTVGDGDIFAPDRMISGECNTN
jgi:hypothetical protein